MKIELRNTQELAVSLQRRSRLSCPDCENDELYLMPGEDSVLPPNININPVILLRNDRVILQMPFGTAKKGFSSRLADAYIRAVESETWNLLCISCNKALPKNSPVFDDAHLAILSELRSLKEEALMHEELQQDAEHYIDGHLDGWMMDWNEAADYENELDNGYDE